MSLVFLCIYPAVSIGIEKQYGKFIWSDELCEYSSLYDQGKYSEAGLKNTYDIMYFYGLLSIKETAWDIKDIKKLDIHRLDIEYQKQRAYLEDLDVANDEYWINYKKSKINELEEYYKLKRITIMAYSEPKVLLDNSFTKECFEYANVLNDNNDLNVISAWRRLHEKQKLKNVSPDALDKKFNERMGSKDRLLYAKMELMMFGWWNCANTLRSHVNFDANTVVNFTRLFISTEKNECDEP